MQNLNKLTSFTVLSTRVHNFPQYVIRLHVCRFEIAMLVQWSEVPVVTFLQQAPLGFNDYLDSMLQAFESFSSVLIWAVMEKHLNVRFAVNSGTCPPTKLQSRWNSSPAFQFRIPFLVEERERKTSRSRLLSVFISINWRECCSKAFQFALFNIFTPFWLSSVIDCLFNSMKQRRSDKHEKWDDNEVHTQTWRGRNNKSRRINI